MELITYILILIAALAIWEAVWKAIALWRAVVNRQLAWFICIFIFNTVGILPIVYLYFFGKRKTFLAQDQELP